MFIQKMNISRKIGITIFILWMIICILFICGIFFFQKLYLIKLIEKFIVLSICSLSISLFYYFYNDLGENLHLLFYTIIGMIIVIEILLGIYPNLLGRTIGNEIESPFGIHKEGIYYFNSENDIHLMKPNFKSRIYFNGDYWYHQTDERGFRNSETIDQADIILLGDSFIYGVLLNENQTLSHYLRSYGKYSVYNFGQIGNSAYDEMYKFNVYGLSMKPKYIVYFFYTNDIQDNIVHKKTNEMGQFINTPLSTIQSNFPSSPIYKENLKDRVFGFIIKRPYVYNIYLNTKSLIKKNLKIEKYPGKKIDEITYSLSWNYTFHAIEQMNYVSEQNNMTFIIVPITPLDHESFTTLYEFSKEKNISFINTTLINSDEKYYIPRDGHFNEEGHKEMAKIIFEYLEDIENR